MNDDIAKGRGDRTPEIVGNDNRYLISEYGNIVADNYDGDLKNALSNYGVEDISVFAEYKVKIIASRLSEHPANILEFGCGTGRNNPYMKESFPASNILGCDISEKSIEIAKKNNPGVEYSIITTPEKLIDIYKSKVDCIFITNVFHHIPFDEHRMWIDALYNILQDDGNIFIFEHNPYNPIVRRIFEINDTPFGACMVKPSYCRNLLKNAGFYDIKQKYTLFFLRRNKLFEIVEQALFQLPLGAQYYVWGKSRPKQT